MFSPEKQKQFDDARYERLKETVSEYLDDDSGASTRFLDDLEKALLENVQYFKGRVDQYTHVQEFFK